VTAANVVLDASVLVRSFAVGDDEARRWTGAVEVGDIDAAVPDLVFAEVANTAAKYIRAERASYEDAQEALRSILELDVDSCPTRDLVQAALAVAVARGLSVYDACYVVLAEALGATLVTADRSLAAAADRAELIR
jgi:predicted nucleic acid-binding protein